jgi:hypothetical protein
MRYILTLTLLGIVIAGCSPRPSASKSAKEVPPDAPDIANVAPEDRTIEEATPSDKDPSLPVITPKSPAILLTPIQGDSPEPSPEDSSPPENWQTFTSTTLGITVNYPTDWSVAEGSDGVTFTSPSGATIQLLEDTAATNDNETKIGNQYCTSRTNEYGQTADICVDNASFIYTAKFTLRKEDGSTHWVTLMTKTRTAGEVFEAIFNSLKPTN